MIVRVGLAVSATKCHLSNAAMVFLTRGRKCKLSTMQIIMVKTRQILKLGSYSVFSDGLAFGE